MSRTRRPIASALTAAGLAATLALPSATQTSPAVPDLDPADCSNGTFVSNPASNPGSEQPKSPKDAPTTPSATAPASP